MTSKDTWDADAYSSNAGFVPALSSSVVGLLDPQPDDHILDLGCGDGVLSCTLQDRCARLVGVDPSHNLITRAKELGLKETIVAAAQDLVDIEELQSENFNKVFSNAALHWVFGGDPSQRDGVVHGVRNALKAGGVFVAECGGFGNCAEVHSALISAMVHVCGVTYEEAQGLSPWWFATEQGMSSLLERNGFQVSHTSLTHRPTELPKDKTVRAWVETFGFPWLDAADKKGPNYRQKILEEVELALRAVARREEDGVWIVNYIRLRFVAVKV
ncbi:hypothetical protein YB2330_004313 [Saitoella coloradoensis]